MIHRDQKDFERLLTSGRVTSIHHKPEKERGGLIYEGTPSNFVGLQVAEGVVSFTWIDGQFKTFPLSEVASVGTN